MGALAILKCAQYGHLNPQVEQIPCHNGSLTIIAHNNSLTIVDPGFLGQRISAPTWVEYTLIPLLLKKYGHTTIAHLIILQPTIITFEALDALSNHAIIETLYIPSWQGTYKPLHNFPEQTAAGLL